MSLFTCQDAYFVLLLDIVRLISHLKWPDKKVIILFAGGCSSVVEPQPSKLVARVRFPLPAPFLCPRSSAGQSNGLLSRGPGVRIPPGTPLNLSGLYMVDVAQSARAPDCGSGGRGFKSHHPPHFTLDSPVVS